MDKHTPWHRLLGMALTDLLTGRPWRVELETELALKSQRLDLLIIERDPGAAPLSAPDAPADELPDGLENLAPHNLMTYKSHQESLDAWALEELIGHYVTYRKLCSIQAAHTARARSIPLLPAAHFHRYAVATRAPQSLFRSLPPGTRRPTAWPGVYNLALGMAPIRLIVIDELDPQPRNAPWELFASTMDRRRQGLADYHARSPIGVLLRRQLTRAYHLEELDMAYTVDDFKRESIDLLIDDLGPLTAEQTRRLLERMNIQDLLRGLPPEERLRGLPPEERLRGLDAEELHQLQEYLKKLN
jgi:hypothetical protein